MPEDEAPPTTNPPDQAAALPAGELDEVIDRLQWRYHHPASTLQSAKTSVTALRREATGDSEVEFFFGGDEGKFAIAGASSPADAAAIGVAHHQFLQALDLERMAKPNGAIEEATRLLKAGQLTAAQAEMLDIAAISSFWSSEVGVDILLHRASVHREVPFTVRVTSDSHPGIPLLNAIPTGEFVVLQGAIDLAVILPAEIWIVDFKTDHVNEKEAQERATEYFVQLRLYAMALSQIYRKPVTRCWLHFLKPGKTIEVTREPIAP
jgi:ATP-dependent helicase/nuclease subunit A